MPAVAEREQQKNKGDALLGIGRSVTDLQPWPNPFQCHEAAL